MNRNICLGSNRKLSVVSLGNFEETILTNFFAGFCVFKNLQYEMDKQESSLKKFVSVTHQLLTECHPSVADTLNTALQEVNIR